MRMYPLLMLAGTFVSLLGTRTSAGDLYVGRARVDITPELPVALDGQFHMRIAQRAETPLEANILAIETREGDQRQDVVVAVACDLVYITDHVRDLIRKEVASSLPDLDTRKIFVSATHTHTAPVTAPGKYPIPEKGVTQVEEYCQFLARRIAQGVLHAWRSRVRGSVAWGLGHAVVGRNRRAVYFDGRAVMYGRTNSDQFSHIEGYEDHDVDQLFFQDNTGRLLAVAVTVACPAQEVEGRSAVNADYWHPVRQQLRERFGEDLAVIGWIGAAGDQSPHLMYGRAAEDRMLKLRGLDRLRELARRITGTVFDTYEVVRDDAHRDLVLNHTVQTIELPMRLVTDEEYEEAKSWCERLKAEMERNEAARARSFRRYKWYERTVERYELQKRVPRPTYEVEIHVIRLGDVAICTNPFELFTDYGIRIKARSPAVQTFVVQLVGSGTYLPTARAVRGGGYSAVVHSSLVGPQGGRILVDRTVELLWELWR